MAYGLKACSCHPLNCRQAITNIFNTLLFWPLLYKLYSQIQLKLPNTAVPMSGTLLQFNGLTQIGNVLCLACHMKLNTFWRDESLLKILLLLKGDFPRGHWPRKGVWGCVAVMTPFFQASRRSLAYQFTIIAPLWCPPFSNFRKIFHFQPFFGQNFSSQDANFPNFRSQDPSFFKENPLLDPTFGNPCGTHPPEKKLNAPTRGGFHVISLWTFLLLWKDKKKINK